MFGIEHYALFLLSGLLLNITPGRASAYLTKITGVVFIGLGLKLLSAKPAN
jgi:threonine/homoserine/homoserine lactone efflux protein